MDEHEEWAADLQRQRTQKDEYFAQNPRSPIPASQRGDFDGLSYYPPDEDYRFELPLHEFDEHDELEVETTTDGRRTYLRWGEFRFSLDGSEYTLTAYRADADDGRLWVPFTDATNGETTYGGGRYLDLEPEDRAADGSWVLDFNDAYSPFCLYSERYECPLVPSENHLDVPIEAGERADY
ncbi:DUF1684 domain-containing protein [Halomarina litorea]|uniref:DUF1684 domain-containing protein n=1 Tax=Halomarina litorea TaxID=2961595 RepID=UPI0020C57090|nr:DUF1684 domain-containing protein [Halomarina sp. BCD28]